jgi:uncharacterized protein (UPF0335 family)
MYNTEYMKNETNPAKVASEKLASFIVSDTIKEQNGNRAIISEFADAMQGIKGYGITQKVVRSFFGLDGKSVDERVFTSGLDQLNIQTFLVRNEIVRRLTFFSRPVVGKPVK